MSLRLVLAACMVPSIAACGGDADPPADACQVTVTGAVSVTRSCRIFLCYPTGDTYQSLDIAGPIDDPGEPRISIVPEVNAPKTFAVGSYTLDDLRTESQLEVGSGGKTYRAREGSMRSADEQATLSLTAVRAPSGDDVCSGTVNGTLTAQLVEMSGDFATPTIGTGRVNVQVTLHGIP